MEKKKKIIIGTAATISTIGLILGIVLPLVLVKNSGTKPDPVLLNNSTIKMGSNHSSLLTEDGTMYTWGYNKSCQLGDGTTGYGESKDTPTQITEKFPNEKQKELDLSNGKIEVSQNNSSLLTEDGRLFMWGGNTSGQIGDGTENNKNTPTEITRQFFDEDEDENVEMIDLQGAKTSLGNNHSSLLTEDGRLFMWGSNYYGQLGDGTGENKYTPTEITEFFVDEEDELIDLTNGQISMGGNNSSLLTENGRLFMWGSNNFGQLGNGTENNKNKPTEITDQFEDEIDLANGKISIGHNYSSLLTEDGRLFMWGKNEKGQLGDGTENNKNKPTEITDQFEGINLKGAEISLASESSTGTSFNEHSSLLTQDGRLFMWGDNKYGQLGDGTEDNSRNTPTEITEQFNNKDLVNAQISMGGAHSSLLTEEGRMFIWGFNRLGQLGDETRDKKITPIEITNNFI